MRNTVIFYAVSQFKHSLYALYDAILTTSAVSFNAQQSFKRAYQHMN